MVPAALPVSRSLHVATLRLDKEGLTILASSEAAAAPCPLCGERSDRVHSRYMRTLADLFHTSKREALTANPIAGKKREPSCRNHGRPIVTPPCVRPNSL